MAGGEAKPRPLGCHVAKHTGDAAAQRGYQVRGEGICRVDDVAGLQDAAGVMDAVGVRR